MLGRSSEEIDIAFCKQVFKDNPLDQGDQQTPIAIVRKLNDEEADEIREREAAEAQTAQENLSEEANGESESEMSSEAQAENAENESKTAAPDADEANAGESASEEVLSEPKTEAKSTEESSENLETDINAAEDTEV